MVYKDAKGHFISKAEAERLGIAGVEEDATAPVVIRGDAPETPVTPEEPGIQFDVNRPAWAGNAPRQPARSVFIDTGRGQTAEVHVGDAFQPTIERLADEAHYGGFFRVFLNGTEIEEPGQAPETILEGQRISITAYDKVG